MSFNDILKLKKQKEEVQNTESKIYTKYLVVGKDLFSAKVYTELAKKVEKQNITFLSPEKIESLRDLEWKGPSRARGENMKSLKELIPATGEMGETEAIFFKEGKFHPFGSRAKSSPLLEGEEYFKQSTVRLEENGIYPELYSDEVQEDLLKSIINCPIVSVSFEANPEDLVEPVFWTVSLSDGREIKTSNLFWGLHPFLLIDLLKNKDSLDRGLIEQFQSLRTKSQISVEFQLKNVDFVDSDKTWFLPLSQTHDWGHFIGDFYTSNDQSVGRFIHFLDEKEVNEDDVAKKLRILKRNFEKILDEKKEILGQEYVRFEEYSDCQKINDKAFQETELPFKNLYLFGNNAPFATSSVENANFEDSEFAPSHFVRGLLTTQNVLQTCTQ